MYQVSPMNWIIYFFFLIYSMFYLSNNFKNYKIIMFYKKIKKIYVK